jgi:CHASE3 domain sensor protein
MNKNNSVFMIVACFCIMYLSFGYQSLEKKVEKMEDQIKQIEDSVNSIKDVKTDVPTTI